MKIKIMVNQQELAALLKKENKMFLKNNKTYKTISNVQTHFNKDEISEILTLADGGDVDG